MKCQSEIRWKCIIKLFIRNLSFFICISYNVCSQFVYVFGFCCRCYFRSLLFSLFIALYLSILFRTCYLARKHAAPMQQAIRIEKKIAKIASIDRLKLNLCMNMQYIICTIFNMSDLSSYKPQLARNVSNYGLNFSLLLLLLLVLSAPIPFCRLLCQLFHSNFGSLDQSGQLCPNLTTICRWFGPLIRRFHPHPHFVQNMRRMCTVCER